jgi:predicted CoA-binding protein
MVTGALATEVLLAVAAKAPVCVRIHHSGGGMGFQNPPDATIKEVLSTPQTVAVVGCSPDPHRDSHRIAKLLKDKGHRVIPVNPGYQEILGEPCYASLRDIPEKVDMVDIFRRSEYVAPIVDDAIATGAKIVWMQLGVIDEQAAARAEDAGLIVVMDRCPAIEYRRLF